MAVNHDDDLAVFIDDMRTMSDFVYRFANIRNIVRKNEGKVTTKVGVMKQISFCSTEEKNEIRFFTPALVITQDGGQIKDGNKQQLYDITPAAILTFLENNRKYFKEPTPDAYLEFDDTETESKPFGIEAKLRDLGQDNMKIVDYDDRFSTTDGGLVYGVITNLTRKWVAVVFRGTIGLTDANTDRDFRLDETSFFESKDYISVPFGKPATHKGFTEYLFSAREEDSFERPYIDRILACVNDVFESDDIAGKGFKLYVSGHSLGGGLANLFAFRVAQLKAMGHATVKHLPIRVKAMSFASPCVGNHDYNKEFQALEKNGFLRHIRVSNEGDIVPTNNIPLPFNLAMKGNPAFYTQNGVNLFLLPDDKMVAEYRNTKDMMSQFGFSSLSNHGLEEYEKRMDLPANQVVYQQSVEELYQLASDFTN